MPVNILFVITSLGGGGAERIISYLSLELSKNPDYKVSILLLKNIKNQYINILPSNIKIYNLNIKSRLRWNSLKIAKKIIKIRPDICFIGLDGINMLLSPFAKIFNWFNIKTIVRETIVLSKYQNKNLFNSLIYKYFYNNYNYIIAQSDDMRNDLIENWNIHANKIIKINNPISTKYILEESEKENQIPNNGDFFVASGRLVKQKGFKKLIQNYSNLIKEGITSNKLYILGDGPLKEELNNEIKKLGTENFIKFTGRINNPFPFIINSKGFILSSDFEGFPNVLLEANALGIPIFSNNCPGGINEIIIPYENGIITDFNNYNKFKFDFIRFKNTHFDKNKIKELNYKRYDTSVILPKYLHVIENA